MASEVASEQDRTESTLKPSPPLTLDIPPPIVGHSVTDRSNKPASPTATKHSSLGPYSPKLDRDARQQTGTHTPWPTPSGGLGSPSAGSDRVFPIRSVVSVDPAQTPFSISSRQSKDYFPSVSGPGSEASDASSQRRNSLAKSDRDRKSASSTRRSLERRSGEQLRRDRRGSVATTYSNDKYAGGRLKNFFSTDANSEQSSQRASADLGGSSSLGYSRSAASDTGNGHLVTARFKHIVTKEGHAVITGRDGETLQRCEDEPIHIPGAVQSFGLLIALEENEDNQLVVRVVSENSHRMIGYHPRDLFRLESFTDILSDEQVDNLLDHVDFIRDEDSDPATNGPEVFTIAIKGPHSAKPRKLWCAIHINPASPDLIVCEFELDDDKLYPLTPLDDTTPEIPEDTLEAKPTEDEVAESTLPSSKPLRVLRSARKRKGEAAAMEVFNIMSQVQEQLANAKTLDGFLKVLVGVVKELTGFHRVMVYQFDSLHNGRVVTELVDPRATKDLYKGLNFPASDIPKQARELYKINKVRLLYDRDLQTARLVCRTVEDLETPLDLTFSYLRAMSPIHIKYLTNMAVRSSMSISINAFGELWGLISCHTYGNKGMRVPFPIRKMCRLVGDTASRNIERLSYASRLQARKLINTVPTQANPAGYIIASSDDLLKLFDADFGLLSIRGETKLLGKIDQTQEALAMLEYLRLRKLTAVITSQDIKQDFPDLRYSLGFDIIAGLLLVPLSVRGNDFIVFFRKPQAREVKWAGNPYEKLIKEGTEGFLEPRKSFKTWSETVIGKCREWTDEQVETAAVLCLVYGKFIEVWRQKEQAMQNSQLTKLLLANSAHEVRTPLNAIINYLEIALEGQLDQETREHIVKSHSASKSLIYVINDLLDLTKTEEGQDLIKEEVFDLPATIRDAAEAFRGDTKRKGLDYQVIEHPDFPQEVYGDPRRTRQAVANIVANAIQNTSTGFIRIEMWLQELTSSRATVEIVISDSGTGMSKSKLDELFRELEQVTGDGQNIQLMETGESDDAQSPKTNTLGLGLAMVARHVGNAEGQLRLKSEEGKGSRFVIQLPFTLLDSVDNQSNSSSRPSLVNHGSQASGSTNPPPTTEGERTLINKARSASISRKSSFEEILSLHSHRSGSSNRSGKSDVDRLIDAISGPLQVGEPEPEERSLQRRNSKGSLGSARSAGSLGKRSSMASGDHRPGRPTRSVSFEHNNQLRSPVSVPFGAEFITDTKTLMSAVKIPDEFSEDVHSPGATSLSASRVSFEIPQKHSKYVGKGPSHNADNLQTLVAEDDPVNSRIIQNRLEKSGHTVFHTINGEECASAYEERPTFFDVVLMDMQMPIVDGLTSTKMIRSIEKSSMENCLSARASINGRVPIFAVSASLLERERQTYINAGFDGWILKPIDFKRLNMLLEGIVDDSMRNKCLYKPGEWEKGGWFQKRQPLVYEANASPSNRPPVQKPIRSDSIRSEIGLIDGSDSGTVTPTPSRTLDKHLETETVGSRSGLLSELEARDLGETAADTELTEDSESGTASPPTSNAQEG